MNLKTLYPEFSPRDNSFQPIKGPAASLAAECYGVRADGRVFRRTAACPRRIHLSTSWRQMARAAERVLGSPAGPCPGSASYQLCNHTALGPLPGQGLSSVSGSEEAAHLPGGFWGSGGEGSRCSQSSWPWEHPDLCTQLLLRSWKPKASCWNLSVGGGGRVSSGKI